MNGGAIWPRALLILIAITWHSIMGGVNQHLESGNRGPKNLESGNWSPKNLESGNWENIWNLGSGGLGQLFWQNNFSQQLYGPKISKHKYILQMDTQAETVQPNTLAITGAWWYNHNHNAPKYARTFQGSHQISEGIFQMASNWTPWNYVNVWPIESLPRPVLVGQPRADRGGGQIPLFQ